MKKPAVHYVAKINGNFDYAKLYDIACGNWGLSRKIDEDKRKVTCRNCKRTKIYQGK